MCFHFSLNTDPESLANRYDISAFEEDYPLIEEEFTLPQFHIHGYQFRKHPVIVNENPTGFELMHWGLVPSWAKTEEKAKEIRSYTLNARIETVFEKKSFKNSIGKRNCLVPATGFFEWKHHKGEKIPHFIHLKDNSIFSFAGIWSETKLENGGLLSSFSILTTIANPLMAEIHNTKERMPVIVPMSAEKDWLNMNISREEIEAFQEPIDDSIMEAWPVSKLITDRKRDSNVPEVLERVDNNV